MASNGDMINDLGVMREQILNLESKLQCERDRNFVLRLENNGCLYKTIDCLHKAHPKVSYDTFSESFDYIPILENVYENGVANENLVDPQLLTLDCAKTTNFDESKFSNKYIVAVRLTNGTDFNPSRIEQIITNVKKSKLILYIDETFCTMKHLSYILDKLPASKIVLPFTTKLTTLDPKTTSRMRKCSFLVSEQLDDSLMIQFLEILPLRQILLAFPNNEKMLKQEPNVAKMLSDMQELVEYVAEHKDLEPEQLILATANNACKLMPKLKAICDEIVEREADIEEAESEEEHDDSSGIGSVTVHEKSRKEEYRKEEVEYQQNRNYQDSDSELENFDERYDTSSFVELLMDQNAKLELLRAYVEMLRNQQSPAISSEELDEIYNKNDKSSNKQKSQKQSPIKNSDKKNQNTKETKKPIPVREIVNGCFKDDKGRWHDVLTGRYCKAPEGFETAETPKKSFSLKNLFNKSKKQASDDNKPPKQVDTQGKYFQDSRGRWHGPDGKFCKPPAGAETMVNSKSSEVTKTNGAAQPNEKKTYEGGYYLDSRNRWHGPDGKFCTPPVNVTQHTTPIKSSPVAQMPAKVVPNPTSERKTTSDGYFQDGRGRWHGPNGKFSKPPELLKTSSPVPPPPVQVSTPVVSSNTQNSTSSTRITTNGGNYQDVNGRWHGANGRFIKAPEPPSYSSYTPSYSSNYGSSGYSSMSSTNSYGGGGGYSSGGLNGYKQDCNGRWHGPDGRFCKNPY